MTATAEWIEDLELLDLLELQIKYGHKAPKNERSLKQLKRYYRKTGTMERQQDEPKTRTELDSLSAEFAKAGVDLTSEQLANADRAGFHVGYIKNAEGEIEYTKPLPHVDFGKKRGQAVMPFQPVEAARITASRAKFPSRNYESIFIFSDAQIGYRRIDGELIPLHDEAAIAATIMLARYLRPNYVVDAGDTCDMSEVGKYPVDSDHFLGTLQPSLQRTHDMLAAFTAATPGAERFSVDSNHVKRLGDYVLRNAFPLYGIRAAGEKYPALSFPGLLKMDEIGWRFIGGYGTAAYDHKGLDELIVIHGTDSVSQGSTAVKLGKKNIDRNIIQGHAHRMESQFHTDRKGRVVGAFVVGALCRRDGIVPGYWSAIDEMNQPVKYHENWQNGVMHVRDYGDGHYQFDQIPIINGRIFYDGKEFDGNKET